MIPFIYVEKAVREPFRRDALGAVVAQHADGVVDVVAGDEEAQVVIVVVTTGPALTGLRA